MTLSCPECERDMLITSNEADFAVHNVGKQEFSLDFDDPEPDDASPIPERPSGRTSAPRRGGKAKSSRGRPSSTRGGSSSPRKAPATANVRYKALPKYAQLDAAPRNRSAVRAKSGPPTALILAALFVVISIVGYLVYAYSSHDSALARARAAAAEITKNMSYGRHHAASASFAKKSQALALERAIQKLSADGDAPLLQFSLEAEEYPDGTFSTVDTFRAVYHTEHEGQTYRLMLRLSGEGDREGWQVVESSFRKLTPGEEK